MKVAVLDACVLYSASVRDLLMWLASVEAYSPRWTERIHDEWIRNVLTNNPTTLPAQLERTRRLMNAVSSECLVDGYEHFIPELYLPDPDDRHVLAAAIQSNALEIVTFNLSDFPLALLLPYGIRAVHPDDYLCALLEEDDKLFFRGMRAHRSALKSPPKSAQEYINTLTANRLSELAARLEPYHDAI